MSDPAIAAMRRAITTIVMPRLRALGFQGTFPHLRRTRGGVHEAVMFQFDKYGGGFFFEAGWAAADEFAELRREWAAAGKPLPASKIPVAHCAPHRRARLGGSRVDAGANHRWSFVAGDVDAVAARVAAIVETHLEAYFADAA